MRHAGTGNGGAFSAGSRAESDGKRGEVRRDKGDGFFLSRLGKLYKEVGRSGDRGKMTVEGTSVRVKKIQFAFLLIWLIAEVTETLYVPVAV